MDPSKLVKQARKAAGITQQQLADLASTTQPAVAAYESGARKPTLATLTRLLDACGYDLELVAKPRTRRGAASLAEVAAIMRDDLRDGTEQDATRLLFGFADDFRGSSRAGKLTLIEAEPPSTGDARFDAALAGAAEHFAREGHIPAPTWVQSPSRFVEPWWFVSSKPAFDAYTLARTPASFARHGVFIAREAFDRV